MCGRVYIKNSLAGIMQAFAFAQATERAHGSDNALPTYNGAPSQWYPIIEWDRDLNGPVFISARWGFIPRWMKDATGGRKPINAMSETVAGNGMFREAYRSRRCLMPIDGFFEWKAILGEKAKQPYAIAMADGSPFALAAIWESWRSPEGEDIRTFAVLTCAPNAMMAEIHNRMPVILHPADYAAWLNERDPNPAGLLKPFPAELMTMWPIGRKVGSPRNNSPDILDPL